MGAKKFGQVVVDEAVKPAEEKREHKPQPAAQEPQPEQAIVPSTVHTESSVSSTSISHGKRFRIELNENNSKKRTFPIRNDIGRMLDLYCLDFNADRQTLVNLMIMEYINKHPEGAKFKPF